MNLISTNTAATTYHFQTTGPGFRSWALCTVNDTTGELLITSDWGNWAHRWGVHHLGSMGGERVAVDDGDPGDEHRASARRVTLTEFIGDRVASDVDYLAGKLQGRRGGQRFSAEKTVAAWRRALCERRLEAGRSDIDRPPTMRRHSLTRELARDIWNAVGDAAEESGGSADLLLAAVDDITGFYRYVDDTPYESLETEQTPEDRALREQILPALIAACAETHRARTAASAEGAAP